MQVPRHVKDGVLWSLSTSTKRTIFGTGEKKLQNVMQELPRMKNFTDRNRDLDYILFVKIYVRSD